MADLVLRPRPPFDFALALGYLARSPIEPLDVVADGRYLRAVRLAGEPTLIEVESTGTIDEPALVVTTHEADTPPRPPSIGGTGGPPRPDRPRGAADLIARCFRVDEDPAGLERVADADPVFGALLARLRGARALLMASPFEALIWAILGQQINVAFAYSLKRTLVEHYGDRLPHNGRTYRLFPEPERLAAIPLDELRALKFSRQKAEYVVGLSRLVAEGAIDWAGLSEAPTDEAVAVLSAHRGIGRWTAEYVCMRGLGHPDVLPAADLGLRAAIGRAYGLGRVAEEAEVRAIAARWAGWRSHAAFCWWYSLSPGLPIRSPKSSVSSSKSQVPSSWHLDLGPGTWDLRLGT